MQRVFAGDDNAYICCLCAGDICAMHKVAVIRWFAASANSVDVFFFHLVVACIWRYACGVR